MRACAPVCAVPCLEGNLGAQGEDVALCGDQHGQRVQRQRRGSQDEGGHEHDAALRHGPGQGEDASAHDRLHDVGNRLVLRQPAGQLRLGRLPRRGARTRAVLGVSAPRVWCVRVGDSGQRDATRRACKPTHLDRSRGGGARGGQRARLRAARARRSREQRRRRAADELRGARRGGLRATGGRSGGAATAGVALIPRAAAAGRRAAVQLRRQHGC
jgi:hypothetical protein